MLKGLQKDFERALDQKASKELEKGVRAQGVWELGFGA